MVAQAHGVNAKLVFGWRKLHQKGLLEPKVTAPAAPLLPVKVTCPTLVAKRPYRRAAPSTPAPRQEARGDFLEIDLARVRASSSKRSMLADWVGGAHVLFEPLVDALGDYVTSGSHLHADDTPYPVLAPGMGKTNAARIWTYTRDERPWASSAPPAVWFRYTPDHKGEHPPQTPRRLRWRVAR